jgi:hypothetical protein
LSNDPFYITTSHLIAACVELARGDLMAAEETMREGAAHGARPDDLRAIEAMIAARAGREDHARQLVRDLDRVSGLTGMGLSLVAGASLRLGETEIAARFMDRKLIRDLAPTWVRLVNDLHPLLDRAPLAPRRWDAVLIWPLEAPMIDRVRYKLFREVRIDSGIPEGSDVR